MNAEAKLANVEAQVSAMERGATNVLTCPYCGVATLQGGTLCCPTMVNAVEAILERKELHDQVREIDQIREGNERRKSQMFERKVTLN